MCRGTCITNNAKERERDGNARLIGTARADPIVTAFNTPRARPLSSRALHTLPRIVCPGM